MCACLKLFMSKEYSFLQVSCLKVFQTLLFFLIKIKNHCEVHVSFQDIEHRLQENILCNYLLYSFFMKSSLNSDLFSTWLKSPTGNLYDNGYPLKLFRSKYLGYDASLFL